MSRSPLFRTLVKGLMAARRSNLKWDGSPAPTVMNHSDWSRRRFLKTAAVAGSACAFGVSQSTQGLASVKSTHAQRVKVAIIGGGIAGLHAAYQFMKSGIRAEVFEASARLGGRILSRTGTVGSGLITEYGGEFINSDHEDMLTLVNEFKLSLFNRIEDGKNSPYPQSGFFFAGTARHETDIAHGLGPLAAQISRDAALLDQDYEHYAPRFDKLSVRDYLDRNAGLIGEPYIRSLIENAIRTEYGVAPADSSALQLLFILPTVDGENVDLIHYSDETFVVEGGNDKIIDGLAQALSDRIHLRKRLSALQSLSTGDFHLEFEDRQTINADFVIMAIPFTVLRTIALNITLPRDLRRFIDEVDLGANEKIIAGFNEKIWRKSSGFSLEAWTDLGFSEAWDATQPQNDRKDGALTFFLGGREIDGGEHSAPKEFPSGQRFVELLDTYISGAKAAANGKFVRTNWGQNPYFRGAYTSFKPGQLTRFGHLMWVESNNPADFREVRVGNLVFAGEHLSDEFYGFMNGGAQTGRLAAQAVIKSMAATPASSPAAK